MDIDPELVRRYWENTCSPQERKQVEAWLAAGEPDEVYPIGDDQDEVELREALWPTAIPPQGIPEPKKRSHWRLNMLGYAAAALALCTVAWMVWNTGIIQSTPQHEDTANYRSVTAQPGKKVQLTLPDGTIVHLNSGSTLRYPARFGKRRHVLLEGEAFFDVAKDAIRAFVAETPHITAHVLGTTFNLNDYAGAPTRGLVLESGKVAVTGRGHADTLILQPNDQAQLSDGRLSIMQVNVAEHLDWRRNILRLPDMTLREAIPLIERWYGITISIAPASLAELRIKASFENASLQQFAGDFGFLMNIRYRIAGDALHLYR